MRTLSTMPVWLKVMGKRIMAPPIIEVEMETAVVNVDLLIYIVANRKLKSLINIRYF